MILMAFDRAMTTRRFDAQGFLHVGSSAISKAQIRTYMGDEIPGWQGLGLDANKHYRMYCSAEELAKAAPTFNNMPILSEHVPIGADDLPKNLIVGSMGSDCAFDGTHLRGSQVFYARDAIDGILSNRKRELSCGYAYTPDMTPGEYKGLPYDGKMCQLLANHIALVIEGRAGPDVLVGDEIMKNAAALLVSASMAGYVTPRLAADKQLDLTPIFKGVTAKSLAMDGAPGVLADKVVAAATPLLAEGQTIAADEIGRIIGAVALLAKDEEPDMAEDEEMVDGKIVKKKVPKRDDDKKDDPKPAMDAAAVDAKIAEASKIAHDRAMAEGAAIRTAERAVFPFVGEVVAMDSAAAVYKVALDHLKVDLADIPESGYGALLRAMPKPDETRKPVAMDGTPGKLSKIVPDLPPVRVM